MNIENSNQKMYMLWGSEDQMMNKFYVIKLYINNNNI